jgi:methionine-rich copper-binding protein CopC
MKTHLHLAAACAMLAVIGPAHAASISKSPTAPVIGADDIANYGAVSGTDKWFFENSGAGAAKGQTFTTGNAAVLLKSITYQIAAGASAAPTKTYTIRVGTVAGSTLTFTQLTSETASQSVAWAAGDYVTWTFGTPILLQSNTAYGIDVGMTGSTSSWTTGIPYLNTTGNVYSGGVLYNSGTNGAGTTAMSLSTSDRLFHIDLEKPITPAFTLVATSPADGAANVLTSNPLSATFSRYLTLGTGNITFRNLTDSVDTVIPIGDPRISVFENLLTINPGSALIYNKNYAVRIDPGALVSDTAISFAGITNDTAWNFTTAAGDPLLDAITAVKNHINGTTILSAAQISTYKLAIDAEKARFATSAGAIAAAFDLVTTYDTVLGPLFVARGLPARASLTNDLHWAICTLMQNIMDLTYTPANIANYDYLLNGFKFGSSASFPGSCPAPAIPNQTHTATISASYLNTVGRATQGDGPGTFARKPTGCYLAPGSIVTVTVPAALVNKGYQIRVGAHSWDFSNKPSITRLDRSSLVYAITALDTKIASPLGGGIYIEVPFLANAGVLNVQIKNAVRSPFFSAKSFHKTTPSEWLTERTSPAPWADFQSDKFMMQVPTSWISAMADPTKLMQDWDASMDAVNDLMGFPRIRGKEAFYTQVDMAIRASVFAPGYPSINVGGFSSTATYGGYASHYLVRGPQYGGGVDIEFHEQGHGYFFPKFGGESESNVNLLHVPALHKLGKSLDESFRMSLGYGGTFHTLDTTAIAWMCCFSFSPREVPMAGLEKQYQLKGHAKFVDIARLFGWEKLNAYSASMVADEENGITVSETNDSLMLRLSKAVGRDIRPLFHFWGIYPENPTALANSMAAAGLTAPAEIYDTLLHYKSIVLANNAAFQAFAMAWWGKKPSIAGYWEETDHAMQWDSVEDGDAVPYAGARPNGDIYVEASAASIQARVQELIDLYYPTGRPADTTPPVIFTLNPADDATGASTAANLVATFTKPIVPGTGNITLKNLTDATQTVIPVTDASQVSIAGSVLTINPTADLTTSKSYAILIEATAIDDTTGNSFAGISNDTTWNFITLTPDTTPPAITNLSPTDGATAASISANLVMTFSEPVAIGTGNITIKNLTDASQTIITVPNSQVTVAGSVLTINPTANLVAGKAYAIQIAATAIKDASNNSFAGIADDTTWNFTAVTPDTTAPTVSTRSPADNALTVAAGANLALTFNEAIVVGTGYIKLKNLTDATQSIIPITDTSRVTVAASVLTVNPSADLVAGKAYAIQIDTTAIDDTAGNSFAGIANDTIWNFTVPAPYATWAGSAAFGADGNNDSVANGLAWLLGAANPSANASGLLPKPTQEAGKLVLTFRCMTTANRGAAVLKLQYTNDLGQADPWSSHAAVVPDVDGTVGGIFFDTTPDADPAFINVRAEIPASAASPTGKLFGRLYSTSN